ncbi:hypothetical protein [Cohnella abietis]|uniref:Uncharacterized protein n=1 Tax=Cohnella abietis TaxID=2507935 RepID=A0A3T1DA52_9BACL|nr:hypothetical protein [Cohnella abietis]BBI34965.1 hypothetical protein KCTCHS21_43640 [Cohnella abietis]
MIDVVLKQITPGSGNIFLINEKEITLQVKVAEIDSIKLYVTSVVECLKNCDIEQFHRLREERKESTLYKVAGLFPFEFEQFLRSICHQFFKENRPFATKDVFNKLGTNYTSKTPYFQFVIDVVERFIDECMHILLNAIKKLDNHTVWTYATVMQPKISGYQVYLACMNDLAAFERYIRFCCELLEKESTKIEISWLILYNYCLYGVKEYYFSGSVLQKIEEMDNVFKRVRTDYYLAKIDKVRHW